MSFSMILVRKLELEIGSPITRRHPLQQMRLQYESLYESRCKTLHLATACVHLRNLQSGNESLAVTHNEMYPLKCPVITNLLIFQLGTRKHFILTFIGII